MVVSALLNIHAANIIVIIVIIIIIIIIIIIVIIIFCYYYYFIGRSIASKKAAVNHSRTFKHR